MRVIEPHHLNTLKRTRLKESRKKTFRALVFGFLISILIFGSLGLLVYASPIPKVTATSITIESKGEKVKLPWPNYGQSAFGAVGYGLLSASPSNKAMPTASVAKVMTALAILNVKPIKLGESGPTITLTNKDVQIYNSYIAKNESRVAVLAGEKITERQALEAILLPSANNIADSLAIWAFGSLENYSKYANDYARDLGLKNTTITSASGFPPDTVSTASDIVNMGLEAMANPVIADIVSKPSSKIPVEGAIRNVNYLLGNNGVVGIKTGNTDQAGGVYLFAAKQIIDGKPIIIVGAIMGAESVLSAMNDSKPMIKTGFDSFGLRRVIKKGDQLGNYNLPWGGNVTAKAENNLDVFGWKGSNLYAKVNLNKISPGSKSGSAVGAVQTGGQSTKVLLNSDITHPNQSWRLFRWF